MKKFLLALLNGVTEIRYHLFRSSLSLIGIVLGVMNLTAMFSIIEGAKAANQNVMNSLGTPDMIQVSLDWGKVQNAADRKYFRLDWKDVEAIRRDARTVKNVGVEISRREHIVVGSKSKQFDVLGVLPATFPMNRYTVEHGRQIMPTDNDASLKVCVIGTGIVKEFFKNDDPLGKQIKIRNEYFRVVGILTEFGREFREQGAENYLDWKNQRVLIPAQTLENRFTGRAWFSIFLQSESVEMINRTMDEVRNLLMGTHNRRDLFRIQSMMEWKNEQENFTRIWQVLLGVVAGISLLVGGVGIMNVMLASFTERMREIGIRKAIGATNTDIFLLFLVETIVICAIGGMIGLFFGFLISTTAVNQMIKESMNTPVGFSLSSGLVAVLFSMITGLLSGLYPAWKASRLAPVEALRYE